MTNRTKICFFEINEFERIWSEKQNKKVELFFKYTP